MDTPNPVPLIDLDVDDKPRDVVRINKTNYELRQMDDLSIVQQSRIGRELGELWKLVAGLQVPADDDTIRDNRLATLVDSICNVILIAPPTILAALKPGQKLKIAQVFSLLWLRGPDAVKAIVPGQVKGEQPILKRGSTPPRAAAGSTADRRSAGSRTRH